MSDADYVALRHPLSSESVLRGSWVDVGPSSFLVSPLTEGNRKLLVFRSLHGDVTEANMGRFLAFAVVADWKDVFIGDAPLDYSEEAAAKLFHLHPMLANAVFERTMALSREARQAREEAHEDIKKSQPSGGNGGERKSI